jgi:YD repeat-containing protein
LIGNPIAPLTGTKHERISLGLSVAGIPWEINYNSTEGLFSNLGLPRIKNYSGRSMGDFWTHSMERYVAFDLEKINAQVHLGDGKDILFTKDELNYWVSASRPQDKLEAIPNGFRFRDQANLTITEFDLVGRPIRISKIDGKFVDFTFAQKYISKLQDNFNRAHDFSMNSFGQPPSIMTGLWRIRDPDGRTMQFTYANGMLTEMQWVEAALARSFVYERQDIPWALTGFFSEYGRRIATFGYSASGMAISTEGAGGVGRHLVDYTRPPSIFMEQIDRGSAVLQRFSWQQPVGTAITDPYQQRVSFSSERVNGMPSITGSTQPAGSGCFPSSRSISYDAGGNIAVQDDFNGNRACFASDLGWNLEIAQVAGLAANVDCATVIPDGAAIAPGSRKISKRWHPDWRLLSKLAEPRRLTTYVYNGQPDPFMGNAAALCAPIFASLPDGKPIAVLCKQVEQATTDEDGSLGFAAAPEASVPARVQTWTYNQYGQVLTAKGPRTDVNDTTTYTYYTDTVYAGTDPYAHGHNIGDLWTMTNAVGQVTTYTKYNKSGQLLEMVDPNNVVTTNTYDLRQRLTSVTVGGQMTVYDYWPTGLLKKITQPDGSFLSYEYDAAHRQTAVQDNFGNRIDYTLDNAGNRTFENTKDPTGNLRRALERSIDALGRVQQTTGRE